MRKVDASPAREFGRAECHVLDPSEPLFRDVPHDTIVWMSHGDQLHDAGRRFRAAGDDRDLPDRGGAASRTADLWPPVSSRGFAHAVWVADPGQFPGPDLRNPRTWTMEAFIERSLSEINRRVGPDERVVCGLSGGVDSAVCAALLAKALGPRVVCVFVDTGLLAAG